MNRKKKKKKNKVAGWGLHAYKKADFCESFKNIFLTEHLRATVSAKFSFKFSLKLYCATIYFFHNSFCHILWECVDINWLFIFLKALTIKIFFPHILNCISRRSDLSFVQNGFAKAAVRRCFLKKVFLKTWQCLHENTYGRVFF